MLTSKKSRHLYSWLEKSGFMFAYLWYTRHFQLILVMPGYLTANLQPFLKNTGIGKQLPLEIMMDIVNCFNAIRHFFDYLENAGNHYQSVQFGAQKIIQTLEPPHLKEYLKCKIKALGLFSFLKRQFIRNDPPLIKDTLKPKEKYLVDRFSHFMLKVKGLLV